MYHADKLMPHDPGEIRAITAKYLTVGGADRGNLNAHEALICTRNRSRAASDKAGTSPIKRNGSQHSILSGQFPAALLAEQGEQYGGSAARDSPHLSYLSYMPSVAVRAESKRLRYHLRGGVGTEPFRILPSRPERGNVRIGHRSGK
jgi:hypothetical protein